MTLFNSSPSSTCCGVGNRLLSISYLYPVGSTVYVCKKAKNEGILVPVLIENVQFVKNVRNSYPQHNSYFIYYNNKTWEQGQLCDGTSATALAIDYWEAQQAQIMSGLSCDHP